MIFHDISIHCNDMSIHLYTFFGFNWHFNDIAMCSWSQMRNLRAFGPKTSPGYAENCKPCALPLGWACWPTSCVAVKVFGQIPDDLPSGSLLHSYGKWAIWKDEVPIQMVIFHGYVTNNQRVTIWMLIDVVFVTSWIISPGHHTSLSMFCSDLLDGMMVPWLSYRSKEWLNQRYL